MTDIQNAYYWYYIPEKRINKNTTRLASVEICLLKSDKLIGSATCAKYENPIDIVKMLVRDYEIHKYLKIKL